MIWPRLTETTFASSFGDKVNTVQKRKQIKLWLLQLKWIQTWKEPMTPNLMDLKLHRLLMQM